jgi:hypothetical protein
LTRTIALPTPSAVPLFPLRPRRSRGWVCLACRWGDSSTRCSSRTVRPGTREIEAGLDAQRVRGIEPRRSQIGSRVRTGRLSRSGWRFQPGLCAPCGSFWLALEWRIGLKRGGRWGQMRGEGRLRAVCLLILLHYSPTSRFGLQLFVVLILRLLW